MKEGSHKLCREAPVLPWSWVVSFESRVSQAGFLGIHQFLFFSFPSSLSPAFGNVQRAGEGRRVGGKRGMGLTEDSVSTWAEQ
jgi:hypothetical protein